MDRGRVVLFTGPAASGKTTCGRAWASSRLRPTAWFDHDDVRAQLKGGYVSRSAAAADETLRPEADRQWLLAASVCEAIAEAYLADGVDVALSAFRPPGEWKGCWALLDRMDPLVIVLLPVFEVAAARNAGRDATARGAAAQVTESSLRRGYEYPWNDWRSGRNAHVIDNSEMTVEEIVRLVEALVGK